MLSSLSKLTDPGRQICQFVTREVQAGQAAKAPNLSRQAGELIAGEIQFLQTYELADLWR